ncbi:sensor histidine kinase [Flavihumibacter profundi]|uniref:sensor histidine kinase n=1 Tax=Flavihumibacter profundi TaxID=2716883 RepID=UPI001CC720C7|nr:HAMP domain-containing sensor histidine kinase [Flavihumibacter profundi]MBZ5858696.1 HAMP domain-containing histidine kinase [Flavihumibacter profundi]
MKLFSRYNRINIASTVAIFLLASTAFYFLLRFVLIGQVDDDLRIEQREIEGYSQKFGRLPEPIAVKDQVIEFVPAGKIGSQRKAFQTINSSGSQREDMRQLIFSLPVGGQWYEVKVAKSLEGTDEIIRSVILISVSTILAILVASLLINRLVLRSLWKPFYDSLSAMQQFRLGQSSRPVFTPTSIEEFDTLNSTLEQSLSHAESDYQRLREFTDNASHELQTPLAVIRSKLDVLIQDEALSERQSQIVQSAYDAVRKMARLNHSLLLLSKIENRQFADLAEIRFDQLVEAKLEEFSELLHDKQFKLTVSLKPVIVRMNAELADALLNNLFSNAIRHTNIGGEIRVALDDNQFSLSNSAQQDKLDENKLFDRFYKGGQSSDQHGLGLSIAYQICQVSGFSIKYQYNNQVHWFTVTF